MSNGRFQIGSYWLSKRDGSPKWYATWLDARRSYRSSLGTEDVREAEIRLAEFVTKRGVPHRIQSDAMPLATVLVRYWEAHGSKIPSAEAARYAMALWTDFWGPATIADLSVHRQYEFIDWLKARGYKNSYVSRVMSVGRAAVNRAFKWGEIERAPFIHDVTDRSDEKAPHRLDDDEMRAFLTTVQQWPHVFIFSMIMLNTLARPDAALDLAPAQVNFRDRFIDLNPQGRRQTKKYRPIVPITDTLSQLIAAREVSRFVLWHGEPVGSVKKTFKLAVRTAGLTSEISPYSLRHTMATELRRRGVPAWEVEGMLGHRRPGPTEKYAQFAPDYQIASRAAIDAYFAELGVSWPLPTAVCAPVARQLTETEKSAEADFSTKSEEWMVGVTGIEPVTPTMST